MGNASTSMSPKAASNQSCNTCHPVMNRHNPEGDFQRDAPAYRLGGRIVDGLNGRDPIACAHHRIPGCTRGY